MMPGFKRWLYRHLVKSILRGGYETSNVIDMQRIVLEELYLRFTEQNLITTITYNNECNQAALMSVCEHEGLPMTSARIEASPDLQAALRNLINVVDVGCSDDTVADGLQGILHLIGVETPERILQVPPERRVLYVFAQYLLANEGRRQNRVEFV